MHENHAHCAHSHTSNKVVLRNSFLIISAFMLIEVAGGFATNSLALLSDAGHMLSDAAALGLSLFAFKFGERKGNLQKTFGYRRIEILAATINAVTLIVIAVFIVIEAARRLQNPPEVATAGMLAISTLGLAVNIVVALYMLRGGDVRENVNMRGAYLHVLGDAAGSVGAIAAALAMMCFGWGWADAAASLLVAALIVKSGWGMLKESLNILMEGSPKGVSLDALVAQIRGVDGVLSVHDLHVWSITSGANALTAHVVVGGELSVREAERIMAEISHEMEHLGITHTTLQVESSDNECADELICEVRSNGAGGHLGHSH
ncbi:cation diffusion facilitator family transporter [uncultured Campylobacter sp.]|uniref:cation diffusion facilitator family transporter n=1 Tax=uncultured Campylobacter sp. TaxID=218934 RepID=UPI0015AF0E93|nr:cation diffusion facilitator family transporter [uncultured Campylobacter sp.]